jgi:Mrp family chromosome partitioning ATPase
MDPRTLIAKIASLQTELERLPLAINDGKRRLTLLQQKLDEIQKAPVLQATLDAVDKDQEVIVQSLTAKQAQRQYEFYANAGDPNAPRVVQLKQAWDAHKDKLEDLRKVKANALEGSRRVAEGQKIAAEMNDQILVLQRQQEQYDVVKVLLSRAEKHLAELPPSEKPNNLMQAGHEVAVYNPDNTFTGGVDGIYHNLVRQYYLTQMELNSPTRVRVLQQGSNPTQKEMKKQIMATVFAGLMGFGVMIVGVIGFETFAKRVSSLGDAKTASPMPVVGVIPCKPSEAVGRDMNKRAAANEAIDRLRAHVSQAWLARGATTVAVTSPLSEEGKAFAAFGLASSLAQSGYKTLLVDFDLRDPQLHEFAGVANAAGVCEHLRAEIDIAGALVHLPNGLDFLPAGKWSDEARKAATGEQFENMLERFRSPYDCVVIHGHALLTAAESVEVARRCEVVLVCALYRETTSPLLKRAAERVATMEIPYSGVVYLGATGQEALC